MFENMLSKLMAKGGQSDDESSESGDIQGVDALKAVKFHPVRTSDDFDEPKKTFLPLFAHHFFGDDQIIGVEDASIDIFYCPYTFNIFIAVESDDATDDELTTIVKQMNEVPFPGGACRSEDELLARRDKCLKALKNANWGEELPSFTISGKDKKLTRTVSVYQKTFEDIPEEQQDESEKELRALHRRAEWFLHWFIDGVSEVDQEDDRLKVAFMLGANPTPSNDDDDEEAVDGREVCGLATLFDFATPNLARRLRVAQIWVPGEFGSMGVGCQYLKGLHRSVAEQADKLEAEGSHKIVEVTAESPCPDFRACRDLATFLLLVERLAETAGQSGSVSGTCKSIVGCDLPNNWAAVADKLNLWEAKAEEEQTTHAANLHAEVSPSSETKADEQDTVEDDAPATKRQQLIPSAPAAAQAKPKKVSFNNRLKDPQPSEATPTEPTAAAAAPSNCPCTSALPLRTKVKPTPLDAVKLTVRLPDGSVIPLPSVAEIVRLTCVPVSQAKRLKEMLVLAQFIPNLPLIKPVLKDDLPKVVSPPGNGSKLANFAGGQPPLSKEGLLCDPLKNVRIAVKQSIYEIDDELHEAKEDEVKLVLEKRFLDLYQFRGRVVVKARDIIAKM